MSKNQDIEQNAAAKTKAACCGGHDHSGHRQHDHHTHTAATVRDPVCGMTVDRATARHLAEHDGTVYAFCSIGCRTRFIKTPSAFLIAPGTAGMEATDPGSPVSSDA